MQLPVFSGCLESRDQARLGWRESDLVIAAMGEKTCAGTLGAVVGELDISKGKIHTATSALFSSTQWLSSEMPVSCSSPTKSRGHIQTCLGHQGGTWCCSYQTKH